MCVCDGYARSQAAELEPSWSTELVVNCEGKQHAYSYGLRTRCSFLVQASRVGQTLIQSGSQLWITTAHRSTGKWSTERKYLHREIGLSEISRAVSILSVSAVRSGVVAAVHMDTAVYWDVTPWSPVDRYKQFLRIYCRNIKDRRVLYRITDFISFNFI
jgi:hypothetical protein